MPVYLLTDDDVRFIRELRRWQENLRGPGVRSNSKDGATIGAGDVPLSFVADQNIAAWFKITASATAGDNKWTYTLVQVHKPESGYGEWAVMPDGIADITGYNSYEDMNSDTGQQGNGIDIDGDDYPAGFEVKAVPTNSIVWGRVVYLDDGTPEVWFSYVNAVDGTCA